VSGTTPTDPFGFGGQWGYYRDNETGDYLCGLRYYDVATGRWMNRDPIGQGGGVNLYGYADGDPVDDDDPVGARPLTATDRRRLRRLYQFQPSGKDVSVSMVNHAVAGIKSAIAGVSGDDPPSMQALWWGIDHLGDTSYAAHQRGNENNCNIFAFDCYTEGANVLMPSRHWWGNYPYSANDLGDAGLPLTHLP